MNTDRSEYGPVDLARLPVVLRDSRWWLAGDAGAMVATDPTFICALDEFAVATAAADRAVAEMRARAHKESTREPSPNNEGRR